MSDADKGAKPRRRGVQQENPGVEPRPDFLRHPQHLADQLLSKTRSNQLDLFDGISAKLSPETRRKAIEYQISVLGFDLTHAQQRGFEAALAILTRSGYKSKKVRLTLDQWHADYGIERRESSRGWMEESHFSRDQSLNVLRELAATPWLIYYERKVSEDRWQMIESIGPMWQVSIGYDMLTEDEKKRVAAGDQNPELLRKLKTIEIEFNDVWFDQQSAHYFWKPGNLLQQMFLALHGRRPPHHLNNFITWILSEAEMKRRQDHPLRLETSLDELAHKCRMSKQLKHGNRPRILATLTRNAAVAKKVNLLTDYNFDDPAHLTVTCNDKVFAEAQKWAESRKPRSAGEGKRPTAKTASKPAAVSSPKSPALSAAPRLFPAEVDKALVDVEAKIKELRARRHVNYKGVVEHELTDETREAIRLLVERKQDLERQKYGTTIPPK